MHVGRPQVTGDRGEAGVPRVQRSHLASGERRRGPDRPRHTAGEEQRVLLVVLGATQQRGSTQHQRRECQHGQAGFQSRVNQLFACRCLDAPRATLAANR